MSVKTILTSKRGFVRSSAFLAASLAFAAALPMSAVADTAKANPVTGETETYVNTFTGETAEWSDADNWGTGNRPFVSGNYDPALVDGKTASTATAIDGWTLRVGAYNGATVTWSGGITKIQSDRNTGVGCWLTADATSSITLAFNGNSKQLEGSDTCPLKLSSANAGGITWTSGLSDAGNTSLPFWYYLKGTGTVVYGGDITVGNAQVIKQADITLSGTSQVANKTLVTFGSGTTKTFSAGATIKRLNSSGTDLNVDAHLATVVSGATTLTTADAVGKCELVQTSTGIELYWVDGDPADVVVDEKTYKPSININFTNGAANGLTTVDDVGLAGYEVPGTSWNSFVVANNASFTTVNSVDSSGVASVEAGVSVVISGTRGSHSCSALTPASNPLHGYIDENDANSTPTVTVTGIPYYKYRVIVYHSTDTANVPFGYDTINGTNYTYVNDVLEEGTTAWGGSGAQNGANAISEGGNVLLTGELSGATLTVVGHRGGGANNARGCIAAIQIIEVKPDIKENDLEIPVSGDTTYTVSETRTLSGTVYLTGTGTLTLNGEAKISAAAIDVSPMVTLNVNADRLDGATFIGCGTVAYDGVVPVVGKGWTDSAWTGTVWLKNKSGITGNDNASTGVQPNSLGNNLSKVKFSGVSGWLEAPIAYNPEIVLENDSYGFALKVTNGNSPSTNPEANTNRCTVVKKLSGSGTLGCGGSTYAWPLLQIWDAAGFTGSIDTTNSGGNDQGKTGLVVVFCAENTEFSDTLYNLFKGEGTYPHPHTICVASDTTVTQDSAATWTADTGFIVDGTLNANGTLSSTNESAAVKGSGTVVFDGRAPSPTGDAWWKNMSWTGTVVMKNTTSSKSGDPGWDFDPTLYGNVNSTTEYNNVALHFKSGTITCTVPVKLTGDGLTINNGYGGSRVTFSKLLGNGKLACNKVIEPTGLIRVLDWSSFSGYVNFTQQNLCFGSDEGVESSLHLNGRVFIGAGSVVTNLSSTAWTAANGIYVYGEFCATDLGKIGSGTVITTSDNGVFTLTNTHNVDDNTTDYARIQGTGTLKLISDGVFYRSVSKVNFPTNMTVQTELEGGFLLKENGATYTIGSLAGSGYIRSDWNNGNRHLRILQAKDTTYTGVFESGIDRIGTVTVAPGVSSSGTLTLSATQTASNDLVVESGAKVNLTGTWVGTTTVAGTIGGTGTIDGNLTVNGGCIFAELRAEPLKVTGDVTFSGAITIVYPEGTKLSDIQEIIKVTGTGSMSRDNASFTVKAGSKVIGRALISGNALCTMQNKFVIRLQ